MLHFPELKGNAYFDLAHTKITEPTFRTNIKKICLLHLCIIEIQSMPTMPTQTFLDQLLI